MLDIAKRTELPCFLLLNKIDTIQKDRLLPLISEYQALHQFKDIIPISALKDKGLDTLLQAIIKELLRARTTSRKTRLPISPSASW